jgi:hypothetical protein
VGGLSDYGNESLASVEDGEFYIWLCDHNLVKFFVYMPAQQPGTNYRVRYKITTNKNKHKDETN